MLFSIIVPVFNCEKYISNCIEVILNQSVDDYEIIFVDNNSSDNSLNIIEQLISRDVNKYKLINCPEQGAGPARNAGIKIASGKYILTLDADDIIDSNLLFHLKNIIDTYDNVDLIKFNAFQKNQDGQLMNDYTFYTKKTGLEDGCAAFNYCCDEFLNYDIISGPSWLYAINREYFTKSKLSFSNLLQEDFGLFVYLLIYASKVYFTDYVGYYYIFREFSVTNNPTNQMRKAKDLIKHCSNYKRMIIDSEAFNKKTKSKLTLFLKKALNDKYLKLPNVYKNEFLKNIETEGLNDIYYNTGL